MQILKNLQTSYELLKESVEKHLDSFFDWSVTDERKGEATETILLYGSKWEKR